MTATRNDLSVSVREKVNALLAQSLADTIDLGLQAKQAHWNVKGPNFIALHELFDKVAEVADGAVDDLAERIVALGGTADGTLQTVAKTSRLPAYPTNIKEGHNHVAKLADAIAALGKTTRAAIDESDKLGDKNTADLFTGISRDLDKYLWFVEAHVQAEA
jgi:starvation-inducible DNA-binding protein